MDMIESAVATSINATALALGSVLIIYVLVAFVYGRLMRKYRLAVIFLGLAIAVGAYIVAGLTFDLNRENVLIAAVVSSFIGIELSDLILGKRKNKPGSTL